MLNTKLLLKPRRVRNVDGTNNHLGEVTKEVKFQLFHESHCQNHRFLIADIGDDDIILGYPFFEATNPMINWSTGKIHGALVLTEICPQPVQSTRPMIIQRIVAIVKRTNVAQK